MPLDLNQIFHEVASLQEDEELKGAVLACVAAQRSAGEAKLREYFRPHPGADREVSPEALAPLLASGRAVSDIRTNAEISNCLIFHTRNLDGTVLDDELLRLRKRADALVQRRLQDLLGPWADAQVSGHFWYPPGGFMGWHTNLRKPGWRFYVSHAEEPGRSFFRYRAPETGEIVTAWDGEWNFRLFEISPERPFWHAVWSGTHRFSLGYTIPRGG